ncbi:MAG TPA: SusC/RagA family TonB-linked outer membrane protein, partial [Leeuwenhoekiella sp.]|nr:SusC/RagA family TonB-linked outer membrane protein [Leeuwenhoekiella sp.]
MVPVALFAQNSVTGVVTEKATGMSIPGANIIVQGTSNGTTTDFDGNYTINNVNEGDVLLFSFLGFTEQQITYTGQATVNVALEENQTSLDEVVVIGYGSVTKKDATGAVNQVSTEDFNKGQVNTAGQLITGKIAGVTVTSGGGAPGEGQNINIRGIGSISLNSSPLYVVDGIPLDNSNVGGSRNPLDFINPADIESMTVLKDASSTAIYGSRAANGVILITTKKGKGTEFKFNYSGATTVYRPTNYVDVMNGDEFRTLVNRVGNDAARARLGNASINWQEEIYTEAMGAEHNISTTGNVGNFMPVRASLGYTNQDGVLRGDNFTRTTGSVSLRPSVLDGYLKAEINARGMYTENEFANRDAIGASVDYDPTKPIYSADSPFSNYNGWYIYNAEADRFIQNSLSPTNPIALINEKDDSAEIRRFIGNAKIDYKLHFFSDITATVNIGLDKTNSHGRTIVSENMPSSQLDWNGSYSNYINRATNQLFDAYLTYDKDFGKSSLNAVAGYSYQSFEYDNYSFDSE